MHLSHFRKGGKAFSAIGEGFAKFWSAMHEVLNTTRSNSDNNHQNNLIIIEMLSSSFT